MLVDKVDAELLDAAPKLRAVANYAIGFDNIDLEAAAARDVQVGHTPDVLTDATADLAFALMLAVARRIVEAAAGRARREVAHVGAAGLDRRRRPRRDARRRRRRAHRPGRGQARVGASRWRCSWSTCGDDLHSALERADFVSIHTPADAGHAPPHRRRRAGAHEAHGDPRQHRARPDRRPGRARCRAAARAASRAPASTSPTPSRSRPSTRSTRRRTCWSSPTSARPPRPPAPRWPTSPSTTSSRRSTASRCPTRAQAVARGYARRRRRHRHELHAPARRRRRRRRRADRASSAARR